MQSRISPEFFPSPDDHGPVCNVTILYEDQPRGVKAIRLCRILGARTESEVALRYKLWRFDLLAVPAARDCAGADAASADIIIFSARASLPVNPELRSWMETWLPKKAGSNAAIVTLLDPEATAPVARPLHDFLRRMAQRVGLQVFSHSGEPENARVEQPFNLPPLARFDSSSTA